MAIPLSYIARNLAARRLTTILTAGGMALVVYVFATVLMLAAGLERTLVATGSDDNVVVIRKGARFITTNSEIAFIMAEATRVTTELRKAMEGVK